MKRFIVALWIFILADVIFYASVPAEIRHAHKYALIPGGGIVLYLSELLPRKE